MNATTLEICRAAFRADSTVTPPERVRLLALLRSGGAANGETAPVESRLLRRAEAARRLGHSVRWLDDLARAGIVRKIKLPGRRRSAGFRLADIEELLIERQTEGTA